MPGNTPIILHRQLPNQVFENIIKVLADIRYDISKRKEELKEYLVSLKTKDTVHEEVKLKNIPEQFTYKTVDLKFPQVRRNSQFQILYLMMVKLHDSKKLLNRFIVT